LFEDAGRAGYSRTKVEAGQVKAVIFGHPQFTAFNHKVTDLFGGWQAASRPLLAEFKKGQRPQPLIEKLSESLLEAFRSDVAVASLVDPYGVYQHLMDYWAATMQDDVWMIASDGWQALQDGKPNADLIPAGLIVARYFAGEQAAVEALETERDALARQIDELDEEHAGEDGLLADARNDKGKLTRLTAKARLADIKADKDAKEERKVLGEYLELVEQEAAAGKKVKEAVRALDAKVAAKYGKLSAAEIKTLVVDDKWLAALAVSVQGELDRVSQALTGRIRLLTERYEKPVPQLNKEISALSARVDGHLKRMGFVWK
jgi:type I restriction enzyme M protein